MLLWFYDKYGFRCLWQYNAICQFLVDGAEAAIKRCSYKKMFWKYVENLQENTHVEVKLHFGMGVLP